jgi:hypothetical protein
MPKKNSPLFAEQSVEVTHRVAAAEGISDAEGREWAEELGVSRVGASFGWTREDVEALEEQLAALDEDDDEDDGDGEE